MQGSLFSLPEQSESHNRSTLQKELLQDVPSDEQRYFKRSSNFFTSNLAKINDKRRTANSFGKSGSRLHANHSQEQLFSKSGMMNFASAERHDKQVLFPFNNAAQSSQPNFFSNGVVPKQM